MAVQQNKKSPSKRGMHRAHDFLTTPSPPPSSHQRRNASASPHQPERLLPWPQGGQHQGRQRLILHRDRQCRAVGRPPGPADRPCVKSRSPSMPWGATTAPMSRSRPRWTRPARGTGHQYRPGRPGRCDPRRTESQRAEPGTRLRVHHASEVVKMDEPRPWRCAPRKIPRCV
jgi:hypothetical protein